MKRIKLSILFLVILLCSVAFAALTKTTSLIEFDSWQLLNPASAVAGDFGDISDSYSTILYLEIAYTDTDAQDGVEVTVEVSYGDDNWVQLTKPFTTPPGDGGNDDELDGEATAGQSTLTIDGVANPNFGPKGQKIFILRGGFSESVRMKVGVAGGATMTLCHDILNTHPDATPIWDTVYEYALPIPAAFAFVRVIINNTDANASIYWVTRISKVTGL